jgi:hypothetical protein
MGLFKRKPIFPDPTPTRLNKEWFTDWALDVARRVGPNSAQTWPNEIEAISWMFEKASGVIDHDYRDYVQRYCSPAAVKCYLSIYNSPQLTPWDLISATAILQPERLDQWREFLIEDAESKLKRFAEIIIDPSTVE